MSNSAKSITRIEFKLGLPDIFKSAANLTAALVKYYRAANPEDVEPEDPYINIQDLETFPNEVQFELYSTRRVNLEFQADLLREYLEATYGDAIEELNEDLWVQA